MISIKLPTGEYLDLFPDTAITMKLNNPIFADNNIIPGSYSLPFNIPFGEASEHNARIMGHYDVISSTDANKQIENVTIFFDHVFYKKGTIKLGVFTENSKSLAVNFTFGLAALSDDFKTITLKELLDDPIVIDTTAITKKIYIKPAASAVSPYSILVNGENFEGDTLTLLAADINAADDLGASATLVTSGTTPLGNAQPYIELAVTDNTDDPLSPMSVNAVGSSLSARALWYIESFDRTTYWTGIADFLEGYFDGNYPTDKIRFPYLTKDGLYGNFTNFVYAGSLGTSYTGIKSLPSVNATSNFGIIAN